MLSRFRFFLLLACLCALLPLSLMENHTARAADYKEEYMELSGIRASSWHQGGAYSSLVRHPYNTVSYDPQTSLMWSPDFEAPGYGENEEWIEYAFPYEIEISGLSFRFKSGAGRSALRDARVEFSDGASSPLTWDKEKQRWLFPPRKTTSIRIVLRPSADCPRPEVSEVKLEEGGRVRRLLLGRAYLPARALSPLPNKKIMIDPVGNLLWPYEPGNANLEGVSLNIDQAVAYCAGLEHGDLSDWTLPSLDQLDSLRRKGEALNWPPDRRDYLSNTFDKDDKGRESAARMSFPGGDVRPAYDRSYNVICVTPRPDAGNLLLAKDLAEVSGPVEWSRPFPGGGPGQESGLIDEEDPAKGFLPDFYGYSLPVATSVLGRELLAEAESLLEHPESPRSQTQKDSSAPSYREPVKDPFETYDEFRQRVADEKTKAELEAREQTSTSAKNFSQSISPGLDQRQKEQLYLGAVHRALHRTLGAPVIRLAYDADQEIFQIALHSQFGGYVHKYDAPVSRKYARKFAYWMNQEDNPTVTFLFQNNTLEFQGILEVEHAEQFVESRELSAARSREALLAFMEEFPNSPLRDKAHALLTELENNLAQKEYAALSEKGTLEEERQKQKETLAEEAMRRRELALKEPKEVGHLVCRETWVDFTGVTATIQATVLEADDEKMWLRTVSNPDNIYYLGQVPQPGDPLMDSPYNWFFCPAE